MRSAHPLLLGLLVGAGLVSAAAADSVVLRGGDVLTGTIVEERDDSVVLEHESLGRLEIPRDALAEAEPETPAPPDPPEAPERTPGLLGTEWLAGWKRSFGLGIAGSEGNSETLDLNVELLGDYEDDERRWRAKAAYYLASSAPNRSSGRATTKNQALAELVRDWLFPGSPWFLFAQGRYDFDQLEAWDHRVSGSIGPGYEFLATETFDLRGRLGAGASQTFGGEENFAPEAVVGLEAVWRVSEAQLFETAHTIYPDLSDPGEFRTVSTADWVIDLAGALPLHLKLGTLFEHQSNTDQRKNDLKYQATLNYRF